MLSEKEAQLAMDQGHLQLREDAGAGPRGQFRGWLSRNADNNFALQRIRHPASCPHPPVDAKQAEPEVAAAAGPPVHLLGGEQQHGQRPQRQAQQHCSGAHGGRGEAEHRH